MTTSNKQLEQPAFNSYPDTWGTGPLNTNFGYIDVALGGSTTINATTHGGTVQPLSASDVRSLTLIVTGAPSATVTYEIPSGVGGQWVVRNNTSPGRDIYFRSASATGVVVTIPAGNNLQISCDGTATGVVRNSTAGVNAAAGLDTQVQYNSGGSLAGSAGMTFNGTTLGVTGFNNTGSTVLGDASGDGLTINSGAVTIPNGLVFGSNLLVLSPVYSNVGIGVVPSSTEKLIVAGTIYSTSGGIKFPDGTTQTTAGGGGGGGSVTSVSLNTATTGLTVSGSTLQTITSSGTFLLGGALNIANGGTGATTATSAFNALAPSQTGATGKYLTSDGTNAGWTTLSLATGSTVITGGTSGYVLTNSAGTIGNASFNSLFPSQGGNAGKFLKTDGSSVLWDVPSLTVGTTTVNSASTGAVLYANGSVLGNYTTIPVSVGGTGANLSTTGGASQVLKQVSAGAAVTVGQLAASDLSNGVSGTGNVVLANNATLSSPTFSSPVLGTPTSGNLTNCTGWPGAGTNTGQAYPGSDVVVANSTSWTTITQVTLTNAGTYLLNAVTQLNYIPGGSTSTQVYIDIGLSVSNTSCTLGYTNVCVVNAYNIPGVAMAVVTVSAGATVYFLARYTDTGGGSPNVYARVGGSVAGGPPGTKITYTRVSP